MYACTHRNHNFFLTELEVHDSDITTVHHAFSKANPNYLLDALLLIDPAWLSSPLSITGNARATLRNGVDEALKLMYQIDPSIEPDGPIDQLIIPWQEFSCIKEGTAIARGVSSCILHCCRIDAAQNEATRFADALSSIPKLLESVDAEEHPLEAFEDSGLLSPIQSLSQESLPKALGRTIWIPRNLCTLERYLVLASVFWALTNSGFGIPLNYQAEHPLEDELLASDITLYTELSEKTELFAEVLNGQNWLEIIQASTQLCSLQRGAR